MLFKTIGTTMLLLSLSANVFAGDFGAGNGGDGVAVNGEIYLFDLYESGVIKPDLSEGKAIYPKDKAVIDEVFSILNANVKEIIARKISAIREVEPVLAEALLIAFKQYSWRDVPHLLTNVRDEDGTDINYPVDNLVQVAVRNNRTIRISEEHKAKMNDANIAALVFHEVIYALMPPERYSGSRLSEVIVENDGRRRKIYEEYTYLKQPSRPVRDIVAYLFSSDFVSNPETLPRISEGYLPMLSTNERIQFQGNHTFYFQGNDILTGPTIRIMPRTDAPLILNKNNFRSKLSTHLESVCIGREYINIDYKFKRFAFAFLDFEGEKYLRQTYLGVSKDAYGHGYKSYFKMEDRFYQSKFRADGDRLEKCMNGIRQEVHKYFDYFVQVEK